MIIVYLIPAAFLSLFLHELAHVIAIKSIGGKIVLFKPWPHELNGRLYFGRVRSIMYHVDPKKFWINSISPVIKSLVFGIGWVTIAYFIQLELLVFAAAELVDLLWWVKGYIFGF